MLQTLEKHTRKSEWKSLENVIVLLVPICILEGIYYLRLKRKNIGILPSALESQLYS